MTCVAGLSANGYRVRERGVYLTIGRTDWTSVVANARCLTGIYLNTTIFDLDGSNADVNGIAHSRCVTLVPADIGDIIKLYAYHDDGTNNPDINCGGYSQTSLKILAVVTIIPILTQTTPMPLFMAALSKARLPYKIVFTLGLAFRLIPLVTLSYKDIMETQALRGHDFDKMNIIQKILKGYIPLFIPLILTLLRRSADLDIAIESRGFGAQVERSYLYDIGMKSRDWIFLSLFFIIFAGVLCLLFFGNEITWFDLISGY